jgi:hypothetical protein
MAERRRRIARPLPILVFGVVFLLLPIANYIDFAYKLDISPSNFFFVIKNTNIFALVLAVLPFPVGIGILLVKRWGWWSFLLYSILTIFYNILVLISESEEMVGNAITLIQSSIGFTAMFYFLKPDISAPYMNIDSRGWRFQRRKPIETKVVINGLPLLTKDFSATGFYVEWPSSTLSLNQEVKIDLNLDGEDFKLNGGIVRIDERGVGLAFRSLEKEIQRKLLKWVESQEIY